MSETKSIYHEVSIDTDKVWTEYLAYDALRSEALDCLFNSHKKAVKYSKLAEESRLKFWKMVAEEHPQTEELQCKYIQTKRSIKIE